MNDVELMRSAVTAEPLSLTARAALADALTEEYGERVMAVPTATLVAVRARIIDFVDHLDAVVTKHWTDRNYTFAPAPVHFAEFKTKWCLIVRRDRRDDGAVNEHSGSAVAFVALADFATRELGAVTMGDIYKPASYKKPAKHARGNVLAEDFGRCVGPTGRVNYLR